MFARSVNQWVTTLMNNTRILLFCALLILVVPWVLAADEPGNADREPEKITIRSSAKPTETRRYKVTVDIKGKMPVRGSAEPADLDTTYTLHLQHKYGRWDRDGLRPLEIHVTSGEAASGGQRLTVTPTMFPKITVLLKRDWSVSSLFGITGTRYEKSIPGINYVNMVLLFHLLGGDTPHAIGETWTAQTVLPTYNERYKFKNTITSLTNLDGQPAALVHQTITWTPRQEQDVPGSTVQASADSTFAIADGKLLKCKAQSQVLFRASEQDSQTHRANITIEISAVNS